MKGLQQYIHIFANVPKTEVKSQIIGLKCSYVAMCDFKLKLQQQTKPY